MSVTAFIDSNKALRIYNDGTMVAAGYYHDNLYNQQVQVNGNVVKLIGEDSSHRVTCAYCYRVEGFGVVDHWIENF